MGGAYAAFEDDPVSIWCNPAGTAAQPWGAALAYQTFTRYDVSDPPRTGAAEPGGIPGFLGAVFEMGTADRPQSLGFGLVTPVYLDLAFDGPDDVLGPNLWRARQRFTRVRFTYARDFRFREVGQEGWLPHLAVGLGADVGFSSVDLRDLTTGASSSDSDEEYGGGMGLLLGLYDNTRNLKVNLGFSYQSTMEFDLKAPTGEDATLGPAFGWPDEVRLGVLVFLLEGLPLRITAEMHVTDWRGASQGSDVFGIDEFARTTSWAFGAEYRLLLAPSTLLYPRAGLRWYEAPWNSDERSELPATEEWQLSVSTRDDRFLIFSIGFGISLAASPSVTVSIDASFETGGDAPGGAAGVSVTF